MHDAMIRDASPDGIAAAARDLSETGLALVLARIDDVPADPSRTADQDGHPTSDGDPASHAARGRRQRRMIARSVLRHALNLPDQAIHLRTAPGGAPALRLSSGRSAYLSFSARGDFALIGVADDPLGVDIEEPVPAGAIPVNVLRAEERALLLRLEPAARAASFQRLWTIKEAFLKAIGTGFAVPPEAVLVEDKDGGSLLSLDVAGNRRTFPAKVLTWPPLPGFKSMQGAADLQGAGGLAAAAVILSKN